MEPLDLRSDEPRLAREPARLLTWLGCGLFAAAAAVAVLGVDSGPSNPLIHPEALYPAALYQDLGQWATWSTPFAPYFFPDLPLYFLARSLTGDAVAALYVFAVLQLALLTAGLRWLFRRVLMADETAPLAARLSVLAGAGLMLTLGLDVAGGRLLLPLFLPAFHTGTLVTAVFGLVCLVAWLDEPLQTAPARRWMATLFVLTFLGALSDRLFLVLFVVPVAAALALRAWTGSSRRRPLIAAAVVAGGTLLAFAALSGIRASGTLEVPALTPASPAEVARTLAALPESVDGVFTFVIDRFFETARAPHRLFWFLWAGLTAVLAFAAREWPARLPGFRRLRAASRTSRESLAFVAGFTAICAAATILATVYVTVGHYGVKTGVYGILFVHRYLTSVFVLPIVCLALYLPALAARRKALIVELVLLAALFSSCVVRAFGLETGSSFPAYRHPGVACLDAAAASRGVRVGLAFSFQAPLVNALSRRGLHADQVTRDFEPTTWIDNRVRAGDSGGYRFVVTHSLRPGIVVERAGPPSSTVQCDGWEVYFYDQPLRIGPADDDRISAMSR